MTAVDYLAKLIEYIFSLSEEATFDNLAQVGNAIPTWDPGWTVKLFSFLISLALIIPLIKIIKGLNELRDKSREEKGQAQDAYESAGKSNPGAIRSRWDEIVRHINSTRESEWKLAIIEADKLMDHVLKSAGFVGANLGERLKNTSPEALESLQDIWEAHKVRNMIAHDTDYLLRYSEAKKALELYEKGLKELQAL